MSWSFTIDSDFASIVTVTAEDLTGGSSECHLRIQHKDIAAELVAALSQVEGVDAKALERVASKIDDNFLNIERMWSYYIEHCRCRCHATVEVSSI